MTVLSVDLAARRYGDIGIAVMRDVGQIVDVELVEPETLGLSGTPEPDALVAKLLSLAHEAEANLILLDGPQGWRADDSVVPHMRLCERETHAPGKTGVPSFVKPENWTRMVQFSVAVFDSLHSAGWPRFAKDWSGGPAAVETFPTHAWRVLGLRPLPAKARRPAVANWVATLEGVSKLRWSRQPSHDELQAVVAGLAGFSLSRGGVAWCDVRGCAPFHSGGYWREGFILSAGFAGQHTSARSDERSPVNINPLDNAKDRSRMIPDISTSSSNPSGTESLRARLDLLEKQLTRLLSSPAIHFDEGCRGSLPESQGIYRIFDPAQPALTVRAGRTRSAVGGLRQRVYQNHLMGTQAGNLRAQLVKDAVCTDLETAKRHIRDSLVVQILVVDDSEERAWIEHFMLGVLRPRYCD